jgi:hypothetical protein
MFKVVPDHAIVAADSKASRKCGMNGKRIVNYDKCKILTFDNQYVFAFSGYSARFSPRCETNRTLWNVNDITKALYRKSHVGTTEVFAHEWGDKMLAVLAEDAKIAPPLMNHGLILFGLFVGAAHGEMIGEMVTLRLGQDGHAHADYSTVPFGDNPNDAGYGDVVAEFMANKTPRAKLWHGQIDKLAPDDRIIAITKLVREFDTSGEVGGPIDSVRMTPYGVEWLSAKPKCGPQRTTKPKQH